MGLGSGIVELPVGNSEGGTGCDEVGEKLGDPLGDHSLWALMYFCLKPASRDLG